MGNPTRRPRESQLISGIVFYLWQSHGVEGGPQGLRSFCDWISTDPITERTSSSKGWAATRGANYTVDRWSKWPGFKDVVNANAETECEGVRNSSALRPNCYLTQPAREPDVISWAWQYCTEWGFFQYANYGDQQLVSAWSDLKHQQEKCKLQFAEAYQKGLLPDWPDTVEANEEFGGWDIRPSNVYWTNGEFDPWRALSPQSEEWFAPKFTSTQKIPKCGESPGEKGPVFGMVLRDAQHCYDFQVPGVPDSEVSRRQFRKALREWLKCWRPNNGTEVTPSNNGTQVPQLSNGTQVVQPNNGTQVPQLNNGTQVVQPNNGTRRRRPKNGGRRGIYRFVNSI